MGGLRREDYRKKIKAVRRLRRFRRLGQVKMINTDFEKKDRIYKIDKIHRRMKVKMDSRFRGNDVFGCFVSMYHFNFNGAVH